MDWSNIIKNAKEERKATEECKYTRVTEGKDSFIKLILTTNDIIARLKARVTLILKKEKAMTA